MGKSKNNSVQPDSVSFVTAVRRRHLLDSAVALHTEEHVFSEVGKRGLRVSGACLFLQCVGDGLIQRHHSTLAPRLLPCFLSYT